jgi:hypothetical protein
MDRKTQTTVYHHQEVLEGVNVRPIYASERDRWDYLIRKHHYLGLKKSLVGKALRYVAVFDDCWLALLGWQAAALKCQSRDHWIGWDPITQYQRLNLIANNSRFLILPDLHIKNLASKILSLNLRRLPRDWQNIYGHPVLLAETFVETPRFTGACYRAANWKVVGQTKGFSKSGKKYFHNGLPKQVLVYPLHQKARQRLADPNPHPSWRWPMQTCNLNPKQMEDLLVELRKLSDCRKPQGLRHPYFSVLTISLAAILGGASTFIAIAEWASRLSQNQLRRLRAYYNRKQKKYIAPSEPTIRRVLQNANVESVEACLGQWLLKTSSDEALSVDGKTLRGARRDNGTKVHLLSAFLQKQAVTISQVEVGEKTNEIPMIQPLLDKLNIKGSVVTADAMHTQVKTAKYIVEAKHADYLFIVKENQKNLLDDIATLDEDDFPPSIPNNRQGAWSPGNQIVTCNNPSQ